MGIRTLAVFSDSDAGSPFVAEADEAVRIGDYLDAGAVVDAACRAGADAVHPGYGFLSENAAFAEAVEAAGLAWVGPSPEVIATMGDKSAARRAAQEAGVPTLASSEDPTDGEAVGYPLLVKATAGGGGTGMHLVESPGELDQAVATADEAPVGRHGQDRPDHCLIWTMCGLPAISLPLLKGSRVCRSGCRSWRGVTMIFCCCASPTF